MIEMKIHYNSFPMKILGKFAPKFWGITFGKHVFTRHAKLELYQIYHEECHVKQYAKYGFFGFLRRYLMECVKRGYKNCMYEVEARLYSRWPQDIRDNYKVI